MERRKLTVDGVKWAGYSVLAACTSKVIPEPTPTPTPKESGFPPGIWRYNAGPHDDSGVAPGKKVLYAIDIGIPEIVNPGQEPRSGLKYEFGAVRAGKVIDIDREGGVILIKDERGKIWKYEHLDLDPGLNKDQEIPLHGKLGIISFRSPEGGYSTGLHVHIGIGELVNGVFVKQPIDGEKIGEFIVRNGGSEYNGTLENTETGEILTADVAICFPTKNNPNPCGTDSKGKIINNEIRSKYP